MAWKSRYFRFAVYNGTPEKEIPLATFQQIKKTYPADLATDFKEGDLREMWHVVFNK